jgi:biopolymer transport protein ExbD
MSIGRNQAGKIIYSCDKEVIVAGDDAAIAALRKHAEEALGKAAKSNITTIFVKADAELTFGEVYPALMALHDAGSDGVQLGTLENKEGK